MKQVTGRIVDLARALPTTQQQARDASIDLPPVVSSVIELPAPLKRGVILANPTTFVGAESFVMSAGFFNNGVTAARNASDGPFFTAGLWHLKGFCAIQWNGTAQNNVAAVSLLDPDNAAIGLFATDLQAAAIPLTMFPVDLVLSLDRPGWFFRIVTPATVALDLLNLNAQIVCNRLL